MATSHPTAFTKGPRRYNDEWSFRGLGRFRFQRTRIQVRTGILEGAEPVHDGAPVDPGEPRG